MKHAYDVVAVVISIPIFAVVGVLSYFGILPSVSVGDNWFYRLIVRGRQILLPAREILLVIAATFFVIASLLMAIDIYIGHR